MSAAEDLKGVTDTFGEPPARVEPSPLDVLMASRPRIGSTKISTGGTVYFLSMGGTEHYLMVTHHASSKVPMSDAEIVAMCLCDANGKKVFDEAGKGIGFLQGRDSCDLRKIALEILKHSRIATSDEERDNQEKKS